MSDPFEMLRSPDRRAEPDPEFRVRLMGVLDDAIDSTGGVPATSLSQSMTLSESVDQPPSGDRRRPHTFILLVAAAALIVALTAVALVRDREAVAPPLNEQPSTVPFDPAREGEIAKSILVDPGAEYAPGWIGLAFKEVVLDRSLAETVPGCAPFLDTVFESSGRAAVTEYQHFLYFNPLAYDTQYVVVFPSEAGAEAMFDATVDPRFGDECLQPYRELTEEWGGWCCDPTEPTTPVLFGEPIESLPVVGADDVQMRVEDNVFFTDEAGGRHGPEQLRSVTLRVGRAIIVMDATTRTESGDSPITVDQFDTAIANAVTRARDVLDQPDS